MLATVIEDEIIRIGSATSKKPSAIVVGKGSYCAAQL